jgi:hypothetical protein
MIAFAQPKYRLIREKDNLVKESFKVLWVEWNDDGTFKDRFESPAVGRSLIMSPFNDYFTWQTTPIIEIVEQKENYIEFKTENSIYKLIEI